MRLLSRIRNLRWSPLIVGTIAIAASVPVARADIGVVLADPTSIGASTWTNAGHALVYLSGVCATSPVKARLCQPGEQGSVVTSYPNFHEDKPYSWNIVPLSLYLYGTSSAADRPLYASGELKIALELQARTGFLAPVCTPGTCPDTAHSYWRDLVAATTVRDVFLYATHSTHAQDQALVDWLNMQPNENHYRGITNNCANFTQALIRQALPDAVHRNLLNDLGMMSPKSAARSFSHFVEHHPELGFYAMHFVQQPDELPRSRPARMGTEAAIHQKRYLIPAALIGDHEVAGSFFVAYFFTGRFSLYNEYARYPSDGLLQLHIQEVAAKRSHDSAAAEKLHADIADKREAILGSQATWESYRKRFPAFVHLAQSRGLITDDSSISAIGKQFSTNTTLSVSAHDVLWLTVGHGATAKHVGLNAKTILSPGSDRDFALQLLLFRVHYALNTNKLGRPTLPEFQQEWSLLELVAASLGVPQSSPDIAAAN